jgi:hypothetical protein
VRTSLAGIQAGGTITLEFTDPANAPSSKIWGEHLTQNTDDEIFGAGHNGNSKLTVYSLKEGSNTYFWRDVGHLELGQQRAYIDNARQSRLAGEELQRPQWEFVSAQRHHRCGTGQQSALVRVDVRHGQQFQAGAHRDRHARSRQQLQQDATSAGLEQQLRLRDRFGDYVTIRCAPPTQKDQGNLFTTFGFGVNKQTPPKTGKNTDVRYILFGRPSCPIIR